VWVRGVLTGISPNLVTTSLWPSLSIIVFPRKEIKKEINKMLKKEILKSKEMTKEIKPVENM